MNIEYIKKNFKGNARRRVLEQIELFNNCPELNHTNNYKKGDKVFLKKGTFIHGIGSSLDKFDWVVENGFIASEFTGNIKPKKYFNNVGFWNIKSDILLSDYIKLCSGITIEYTIDRGTSKKMTELVGINDIIDRINYANNDDNIWSWYAEQTKEIRFIPTLASDKNQIAFILNMDSDYAKELVKNDLFKISDKKVLKYFIIDKVLDSFINDERNSFTTNRESAIIYGLPSTLIEGVLLGKNYEKNDQIIKHIKEKLPNSYICNLDGVVIKK